jgi:hypothetical protein
MHKHRQLTHSLQVFSRNGHFVVNACRKGNIVGISVLEWYGSVVYGL